jgi:hypothetical protein
MKFQMKLKISFQRDLCEIKNAKHDGSSYIGNEEIQQHVYQFLN